MEVHPHPNLGLDLVRATEAAALSAARWMGLGQREEADQDAIRAMHTVLNQMDMDGLIVIGEEGKRGTSSPLDSGQHVGTGYGPAVDLVVDPVDGGNLLVHGQPGASAADAFASRGAMWSPAPAVYMEKIVVDHEVAPALVPECMDAPVAWTLALVARIKKKDIRDLVVFVLDRPRHQGLIEDIRAAGARAMLRIDGDIAGALMAAIPQASVDILMGVGGVLEGVMAACGVKALGGGMLGRLAPQSTKEKMAVDAAGLDTRQILRCDDIVSGNEIFFAATGITNGEILRGVRYHGQGAESHSLVLRCETRTRRIIHTEHQRPRVAQPR